MDAIKAYIVAMIFLLGTGVVNAQPINDSVFRQRELNAFRLINSSNAANTKFSSVAGTTSLIAFIFLSPECPLCKNYMPVLNALQKKFGQSVVLQGIIPGRTYSAAVVKQFAEKYKAGFPLLIDPQKKLTNYLHATITPEIILLNGQFELVYRGAIDNRLKQLGVHRWQATEFYFSDAVEQAIQHDQVVKKRVKATGCLINDF